MEMAKILSRERLTVILITKKDREEKFKAPDK